MQVADGSPDNRSGSGPAPGGASWAVLVLLAAAQFMVVLDITIVNVALPTIGRALSFAPADLQWVVTAYVLCSGGLVLAGGRAADLLGRRRTFLAGLTVFTVASLASALAGAPGMLIAARAVQGTGASLMTPSALSIIATVYEGRRRTVAMSVWSAIASGGIAVGVILGGVLTSWLSWHWVFAVNVPVGTAAAVLTPFVVPSLPAVRGRGGVDLPGAASLVAGLGVLVYALTGASAHGWGSTRTIVLLAAAAILLIVFAAVERTAAEPLIPPRVWRTGPLVAGAAMLLVATGVLAGAFFELSGYMQNALGYSALHAGVALLPFVVATGLGVHVNSRAIARVGSRWMIVAGMVVVAIGALALARRPDHVHYVVDMVPGLLAFGFGFGLTFPAITISMMNETERDSSGAASGLLSTSHEVGAALGTAVLSAIAVGAGSGVIGVSGAPMLVGAAVAAALALAAAALAPAVRPPAGVSVGVH